MKAKEYPGPVAEVERKFLLKSLPLLVPIEIREICHYYTEEGRYTMNRYTNGRLTFIKCIKTPLGIAGANQEDETPITPQEFDHATRDYTPFLKRRHVYEVQGKLWEVDVFESVHLIMAEVEWIFPIDAVDMSVVNAYVIPIPMQQYVIAEVTGMPGFSNYQLAQN